jgi:hypothetical protein
MKVNSEARYTLQEFIKDVSIPNCIHTHGAKELTMDK